MTERNHDTRNTPSVHCRPLHDVEAPSSTSITMPTSIPHIRRQRASQWGFGAAVTVEPVNPTGMNKVETSAPHHPTASEPTRAAATCTQSAYEPHRAAVTCTLPAIELTRAAVMCTTSDIGPYITPTCAAVTCTLATGQHRTAATSTVLSEARAPPFNSDVTPTLDGTEPSTL